MQDVEHDEEDAPRTRLYRLVEQLLHAHERREPLVRKSAAVKLEMGEVPADLFAALSDAECAILTLEAEVLDAAYAVIAADNQ